MSVENEIKDVRLVSKDFGSYCVRCPHCGEIIGIDGDDMSEVRGEQYQHRINGTAGCGGWMQIDWDARFVRELPPAKAPQGTDHGR